MNSGGVYYVIPAEREASPALLATGYRTLAEALAAAERLTSRGAHVRVLLHPPPAPSLAP